MDPVPCTPTTAPSLLNLILKEVFVDIEIDFGGDVLDEVVVEVALEADTGEVVRPRADLNGEAARPHDLLPEQALLHEGVDARVEVQGVVD